MFVICCGMPRSASTLQYQLFSEIVRIGGIGEGLGWGWDNVTPDLAADNNRIFVIKVHDPNPEIEATLDPSETMYAYTYRDIRDAAVSMIQWKGPHYHNAHWVRNWIQWVLRRHYYFASKQLLHGARYEKWTRDIPGEIDRVAQILGVSLEESHLVHLARYLSPDGQKDYIQYHLIEKGINECWKTLIDLNKIGDGEIGKWKNFFTRPQLDAFHELSDQWFEYHRYEPTFQQEQMAQRPVEVSSSPVNETDAACALVKNDQQSDDTIPFVMPVFVPPGMPDDWLQPDRFFINIYNNILFVEACPFIVVTNSRAVERFLTRQTPEFLRKRLTCEYLSPQECKSSFPELFDLSCSDNADHVVTTLPKLTPLWKLKLDEYVHLDMDTLVVRSTVGRCFGNFQKPFAMPNVLHLQPDSQVHYHLCKILKDIDPSLPVIEDHREILWINGGVYRINKQHLGNYIREEIYPIYLQVLKNHRSRLRQKPNIFDGDELLFRIMLLFLPNDQVQWLNPAFNYMPQWIRDTSYEFTDARIVHYAGPLKQYLSSNDADPNQYPEPPPEIRKHDPDMDHRISQIMRFYNLRRQYIEDTIRSETHQS